MWDVTFADLIFRLCRVAVPAAAATRRLIKGNF